MAVEGVVVDVIVVVATRPPALLRLSYPNGFSVLRLGLVFCSRVELTVLLREFRLP